MTGSSSKTKWTRSEPFALLPVVRIFNARSNDIGQLSHRHTHNRDNIKILKIEHYYHLIIRPAGIYYVELLKTLMYLTWDEIISERSVYLIYLYICLAFLALAAAFAMIKHYDMMHHAHIAYINKENGVISVNLNIFVWEFTGKWENIEIMKIQIYFDK